MTIKRGIATVCGCALLFALLGLAIGYSLGVHVPSYYRSVFRHGGEPAFDPVSVGIGQGLTQGAAAGIIVGLVIVALLVWRELRLRTPSERISDPDRRPHRSVIVLVWFFAAMAALFFVGIFTFAGWVVGLIQGERGAYHRQFIEEKEVIAAALTRTNDPALHDVQIKERSDGGVYLIGDVPTDANRRRLREIVTNAIGETRATEAMRPVRAKAPNE